MWTVTAWDEPGKVGATMRQQRTDEAIIDWHMFGSLESELVSVTHLRFVWKLVMYNDKESCSFESSMWTFPGS